MAPAAPRTWIVPSNSSTFDAESALERLDEINWSEVHNARIVVGDTVFLYSTAPLSGLTHELVVTRTGGAWGGVIDRAYWVNGLEFDERRRRTWMRLQLVRCLDDSQRAELELPSLRAAGLKGVPQRRVVATEGLLAYIENVAHRTPPIARSDAGGDAAAEHGDTDAALIAAYVDQIAAGRFAVEDQRGNAKVRGSAQRAFAAAVNGNYGYRCAVTGITAREFLVASHIVPWADDLSIRLDPSNGICLSTLVDRAFDTGYLRITPDCVVEVDRRRCGRDEALLAALMAYDGLQLRRPAAASPSPDHLARRYGS